MCSINKWFYFMNSLGSVPAAFMVESIMEHISKAINKHPIIVKELNLYQPHQVRDYIQLFVSKCYSSYFFLILRSLINFNLFNFLMIKNLI